MFLILLISFEFYYFSLISKKTNTTRGLNSFSFQINEAISVSIIIANYNKFKYLEKCMKSLKNQTLQNIEIIFVDDCSTDESLIFIINQTKQDPRIKTIQHTYNQGTMASRNHAILLSNGEYIMIVDPDDELFDSKSIEIAYKSSLKYNADVLEFEVLERYKNRSHIVPTCNRNFDSNKEILERLQEFKYQKLKWNIWKRIIRRNLYQKAVKMIVPFIENKRICNGEDILHTGAIFLFMKNYICGHFVAYIYYKALSDSTFVTNHGSKYQSGLQVSLSKEIAHYLYLMRDNISNCTLKNFLSNERYLNIYNKCDNIVRTPKKNCLNKIHGTKCYEFSQFGYCLITNDLNYSN